MDQGPAVPNAVHRLLASTAGTGPGGAPV